MTLLDRLTGTEEPTLPVHQFWGSLSEWGGAHITRADVITAHNIQEAEESELDFLRTRWSLSVDKVAFEHEIHKLLLLAEGGYYGYEDSSTLQTRIIAIG